MNNPLPIADYIRMRLGNGEIIHDLAACNELNRIDETGRSIRTDYLATDTQVTGCNPRPTYCQEWMVWRGLDEFAINGEQNDFRVYVRNRIRDWAGSNASGRLIVSKHDVADTQFR